MTWFVIQENVGQYYIEWPDTYTSFREALKRVEANSHLKLRIQEYRRTSTGREPINEDA